VEAVAKSIAKGLSIAARAYSLRYLTAARAAPSIGRNERGLAMTWEKPEFVEIKMDCEINSYQDDFQREDFNGIED
jgi:hypothetical protein